MSIIFLYKQCNMCTEAVANRVCLSDNHLTGCARLCNVSLRIKMRIYICYLHVFVLPCIVNPSGLNRNYCLST